VLIDLDEGADRIEFGGTICLAIATVDDTASRRAAASSAAASGCAWAPSRWARLPAPILTVPARVGANRLSRKSTEVPGESESGQRLRADPQGRGHSWVSCYPTSPVNNALGEEGVPILMMGEERFAVAVADAFSRVTSGKQIGACTVMAGLNAAGIQMAYGAVAQAWEDSSPLLVIAEGSGPRPRATRTTTSARLQVRHQVGGEIGRAELVPDYLRRAFTQLRSGRPGPVLLLIPRDLGEYDEAEHPYTTVKGWRTGPDPTT